MQRSVSRLNVVGLVLVLIGAVRYTIISQRERKMREKRDEMSSGLASAKKAAKPETSNGSAAPLLPITAVKTSAPAHGKILVNGKRSGKRGGDGREGGKGTVDDANANAKAKAWSWWNGKSGDASRRNR